MREKGYENKPIIKGYSRSTAPILFEKKMADNEESEYTLHWILQVCLDTYKRAGLEVVSIGSEYAAISAFGLTEPVKEYEAVESSRIALDGDKPINQSGGFIGCGHSIGTSGARMLLNPYRQATGAVWNYQAEGAKNGMMLNIEGSATMSYVFIVEKEE